MWIKRMGLLNFASMLLQVTLPAALPAGVMQAAEETAAPAVASISDIGISFKMNPSIAQGTYTGDRWIAPPYYNVEDGKEITIEAIVQAPDAQGKLIAVSADWRSSDPDMIKISPGSNRRVELTVTRAGNTELNVSFGSISKKLSVKAWHKNEAIHVEISQPQK